MHACKFLSPHYQQTAWMYLPLRDSQLLTSQLWLKNQMVPLHFLLALSPISTSEQDRHRTGNAKCYGAVRYINSVIKVFRVSHFVSDPFPSRRLTAAHLWWDILSSTVNYLEIHFLRFNIMPGDLCKSQRYTDYNGALNWFNVRFRFCAMNIV